MAPEPSNPRGASSEKGIIGRFLHLVYAQGTEGLVSALFFFYLPWADATVFGEVMYALAAGSVLRMVVQFGLYYPLVSHLGSVEPAKAPEMLSRVNLIKLGLLLPAQAFIIGMALYKGFSLRMTWILFFVCLGIGLEAIAETFFAELRVRGRQDTEARVRVAGSILSYGYGFVAALIRLGPFLIGLFTLVSGLVRLALALRVHVQTHSAGLFKKPSRPVGPVFRAAAVFAAIDILGMVFNKANIFFLESATGTRGVGLYSAAYNLVEPVCTLISEQFLGWVVFPLLATLWLKQQDSARSLVRRSALWLMAAAFPIMFIFYAESEFIIGLIFPADFKDAAWVLRYLIWIIFLSFESNLFIYVMMVAGAVKVVLAFAIVATGLNFVFNLTLVHQYGLAGGCLVIVLTKLVMTVLTFIYCQTRFGFFKLGHFLFPVLLAGLSCGVFALARQLLPVHGSMTIALLIYISVLLTQGTRFMGPMPGRKGTQAVL
jgi:O-antigen/teichoic acid export membrane protein